MNDFISRADALAYPLSFDHYDKGNGSREFISGVESYREYIQHLPSVSVESKATENIYDCDLISRADAIKALSEFYEYSIRMVDEITDLLNSLPSVSAERVGEWIHDGQKFKGGLDWCHCSECGQKTSTNGLSLYRFCPNCGARMENKK